MPQSMEQLIEQIVVDAYTVDEQLSGFCQVFLDEVALPTPATVLDVPVELVGVDYPADERRGLVASCRRGGVEEELSLADIHFAPNSIGGWLHAAYRTWLGLRPFPARRPAGWSWGDA